MNFQLYINFLEGFLYNSSWFIALHEWGKICTAEITYAGNKLHALHGGTWLVWNNSGGFASDKIVF